MNEVIIRLLLYFEFYAMIGWFGEIVYYGVKKGHYERRGFLHGPMCPIYGVTMLLAIVLLSTLVDELPHMVIGALFVVGLVEWVTGFILDVIFKVRLWDYRGRFLNLRGYTCAWHSIKAAFAVVVAMVFMQPILYGVIYIMPAWLKFILLLPFYIELVANWVDAIADACADRKKKKVLLIEDK